MPRVEEPKAFYMKLELHGSSRRNPFPVGRGDIKYYLSNAHKLFHVNSMNRISLEVYNNGR